MKIFYRNSFILLIFIVFLILFYSVYSEVKTKIFDQYNSEKAILAKTASQGIKDYLDNSQSDLYFLSKFPDIINFNDKGKDLISIYFKSDSLQIEAVTRLSSDGTILFTYPEINEAIGRNISFQNHVAEIINLKKPVISDVFMAVQGYLAIAIHVPVFEEDVFKGSLAILVKINKIGERYLKNINNDNAGFSLMLSENNIEIYSPFPNHVNKSIIEINKNDPTIVNLTELLKIKNTGTANCLYLKSNENKSTEQYVNFYRLNLGNTNWAILIFNSRVEVYKTINSIINRFAILFIAVTIVILVYFYFFIKARKVLKEEKQRKKAEKEKTEGILFIESIVNTSPDLIYIYDIDERRNIYVNNGVQNILGYSDEEVKAMGNELISSLMHPEDFAYYLQNTVPKYFQAKDKDLIEHEYRMKIKGGKYRILHSKESIFLRKEDGSPKQIFGISTDITERKWAEEKLLASEARFRKIFEDGPIGMVLAYLPTGNIFRANKAFCNMLEYTEEELCQLTFIDITHPDDQNTNLGAVNDLFEDRIQKYNTDKRYRTKNGDFIWATLALTKIYNEKDQSHYALAMIEDISERKVAENSIKQNSKDLLTLLEISQTLTSTLDMETVLQNIIDRSTGLIGLETGAIYLVNDQRLYLGAATPEIPQNFPDEFRHAFLNDHPHIEKAISTGLPISIPDLEKAELTQQETIIKEARNLHSLLYVPLKIQKLAYGVLILGTQKETREFSEAEINLYRTISGQAAMAIYNSQLFQEIKLLNEKLELRVAERTNELSDSQAALLNIVEDLNEKSAELERNARKLEISYNELEAFSYSVSHDLRAPLRAINGFSKFLVDDYEEQLDDEGKRLIKIIRSNAKQMDQLITDLLQLSKVSRNEIITTNVDMKTLVKSVFDDIALPDEKEKFKFIVKDIHSANVDATLIRQVWVNLISNALKYSKPSEKKRIVIDSSVINNKITYFIKDSGVGFNPKYIHKLFGIFQRLHHVDEFEGTGVGLAIVQRIILKHGGEVWAEGEEGKGATFYFSLATN